MKHMKPWRFLTVAFDASRVARKCSRDHVHIRIQGRFTKDSAIYPDTLASELAAAYDSAIRARLSAIQKLALDAEGLEAPFVNELAISRRWSTEAVWRWRKATHTC